MKNAVFFYNEREKEIVIDAPFVFREICRGLTSRRWDTATKTWRIPASLPAMEEALTKFNGHSEVHANVWGALEEKRGGFSSFTDMKERLDLKAEDAQYQWHTRPRAHQVSGTAAILLRDRVLLLDQMGLGKTKQMIDAAIDRMRGGLIDRVVVVVPASLKYNWIKELNKHATPAFNKTIVIDGAKKDRPAQLVEALKARFVIINYELAMRHPMEIGQLLDGQMLICDEAHKIKNMKAKITKTIHSFDPKYSVLATGTPSANKPEDVFSLAQFTEKGLLGFTQWQFEDHFCKRGGFNNKQVVGYKNLDEFRARLATISIRRLKENVLDLPPKEYETRMAAMKGDQRREYDRMREEMVAFYKEMPEKDFRLRAVDARSQLLRMQQITDGFLAVGDRDPMFFMPNAKLTMLDEIVDDVCGNGEKLVVWSRFLPITSMVEKRFGMYNPERIYGAVEKRERFEIVDRFEKDPSRQLLVCQIRAGGEGFDMTAAQTQVFYDLWWSPSVNEQAEDRLHRMGTRGTVSVIRLACEDSVDQYLMGMLDDKKQWSDMVTGDDLRMTRRTMLTLLGEGEENAEGQSGSRGDSTGRAKPAGDAPDNPGRSSGKVKKVRSGSGKIRGH